MNQALNYSPGSHKLVLWRNGSNVTTNKWDVIKRGEKVQLVSLKGTCAALDGTAFKGVKCDPDDRNQLFTVHKKGEEKKVTPTGSGLTYGKCSNHKKSNETFPQAETWGSTE
ncbi:hypothetical protein ECANGB1_1885 [Enterospora canceri]|uniref:Ricin B lectin domain-containing protein n=1 Tax=Enterospora canceri TaxID=1081671 RepID=A0A1Y1S8Y2_9MICR|nr:hypothetical protein ECANGB1_1885 [Enterospora canceri]